MPYNKFCNSTFWQEQRVWVTGVYGFLGSHLKDALYERGFDQLYVPDHSAIDLCKPPDLRYAFKQFSPTLIIHAAAEVGGIGANQARPAEFFYNNLMMGTQLLHEAWQNGVTKFVALGTVCAYPKFTPVPFKESDLWMGYPEETNAPYGLAKKMLLVQSQAYRAQYGFNSIYLIPTNLYGERDNFDPASSHVIPALIRKLEEARAQKLDHITLWGDGTATREFLYVKDAVEGILRAAEYYNGVEPVNLGTGEEISIHALATLLAEMLDYTGIIEYDTTKPNGQPRRSVDTSRAYMEFGFKAQVPLRDGLRNVIQWYREFQQRVI